MGKKELTREAAYSLMYVCFVFAALGMIIANMATGNYQMGILTLLLWLGILICATLHFVWKKSELSIRLLEGMFFCGYIYLYLKKDQISGYHFWMMLFPFVLLVLVNMQMDALHKAEEKEKAANQERLLEAISFTGKLVDAKDPYTKEHSVRVGEYAKMIGQCLGMKDEELGILYHASLVHDIGKIGIPDRILNKNSALTEEEYGIVKEHARIGYEMVKDYPLLNREISDGILYHHEWYDGSGYPEGKKGQEIPKCARIIAIADAFDAMNSSRVFRKPKGKAYIISEFQRGAGSQFDPAIADIMVKLIYEGKVEVKENL